MNKEYELMMIEAFVDKPEKTQWYQNAFSALNDNASRSQWSWWAFFGGPFFLLYRKAYLPAVALFILSIPLNLIPVIGGLIPMIIAGAYSVYFIFKRYKKKEVEIENSIQDTEKRIEAMRSAGGYNQWVVWAYVALMTLIIGGIVAAVAVPRLAAL